jgi:hypothetical protein
MIKVAEPSLTVGLLPRFASSDVRELSLMLTQRLQAITLLESPLSRSVESPSSGAALGSRQAKLRLLPMIISLSLFCGGQIEDLTGQATCT